jgi:CubicO group peptidase (beta-lactamase class C family)
MVKVKLLIFVTLVFPHLLLSQSTPVALDKDSQKDTTVRAFVEEQMKELNIPGISLLVIKDGAFINEMTIGLADVEFGIPFTNETIFQIASASKPFTSVAVMSIVQEGKLGLDDTLGALLPQLFTSGTQAAGLQASLLPSSWKKVTLYQMLTHTSGLPDIAIRPGKVELIADNRYEAFQKLSQMPLAFAPGEKWSYNQTNYLLLRMIIEDISGMEFTSFMSERFFIPLGMRSTSYANSVDIVKNRASLYEVGKDEVLVNRWLNFPEYTFSSAGINTTARDLAKWTEALQNGRILNNDLTELMWQPVKLLDGKPFFLDKKSMSYGCGFIVDTNPIHRSVGHSGGGIAAFIIYPDDKLTIIIGLNGNINPDKLLLKIAELYLE